jgi:DNA polymerase-3 subunit epsilon
VVLHKSLGDRLSPAVKYWIFLTGIITVIFAVIFGSFAASFMHLDPAEQAVVEALFNKLLPFPFIGSLILVAFICSMVRLLFRNYIIPVLRMAEQTRLITAANPDYRVSPEGARELITLANMINESADAYQALKSEVEVKVHQSHLALKEERNRFAALMSELPCGVVVCNLDGRILLFNNQAQEMLQSRNNQDSGSTIGLGRSIFATLERAPLAHALAVMNHAFEKGQVKPSLGLMTKLCGDRFIRVNMAPVTSNSAESRKITGFVLTLEDITGEVDTDSERDRILQKMIDAVQISLGKLHRGINKTREVPVRDDMNCERHREVIDQVSSDLEDYLAMARQLYSEHQKAYGNRENVLAETLVTLIANDLLERFAMVASSSVDGHIWLKIDSYAILQAITTLAGLLKAEHGISSISLHVTQAEDSFATLALHWADQSVPSQSIRDWLELSLFMDSAGSADSPGAIIDKHGGTVTIRKTDETYCNGAEVTLPMNLVDETAGLQSIIAPRPISFEFDLFHQAGQEALGEVALRNLTYVAFDTETTGLNPSEGDEIIQLGAVRILNNRLLHNETFDQLVNPQRAVSRSSVAVHGIDPDLLPSQPLITEVLPKFHAFVTDSVLVAHNAAFDMRFLQLKEEVTGLHFDNPVLDTLLLSSVVHPNLEGHSLDAIAERFNIAIIGRHTAFGDALVTAEILLKLIPLLEAQGIMTLDDALRASIKSPFVKIAY